MQSRALDLISLIYAAAASAYDDGWTELAGHLSRQFNDSAVVIDAGSISTSPYPLLVPYRFDAERVQQHFERFAHPNDNIGVKSLMTGPIGSAFDMHQGIAESVWNDDPSVRAILTTQGLTEGSLLVIERARRRMSSLLIYRGDRAGVYSPQEIKLMNAIAPHLGRAFDVRRRLRQMAERERNAHRLLCETSTGVLVTDGRGHVIHATGQAEISLSSEEFLYVSFGRLRSKDHSAEEKLNACFGGGYTSVQARIEVRGPNGAILVLRELPHEVAISLSSRGDSRAFHVEIWKDRKCSLEQILKENYRLTATETNIAILLKSGASIHEISVQRQVKPSTIRTHMKAIFQKMHTHRQSELIALMNRIVMA